MSRCGHLQHPTKLRKLPKCSKCNNEFVLVLASYENVPEPVWEWECHRCPKIVSFYKLNEEDPSSFEKFLHERFSNTNEKQKDRRNHKQTNKIYK